MKFRHVSPALNNTTFHFYLGLTVGQKTVEQHDFPQTPEFQGHSHPQALLLLPMRYLTLCDMTRTPCRTMFPANIFTASDNCAVIVTASENLNDQLHRKRRLVLLLSPQALKSTRISLFASQGKQKLTGAEDG